ncbi:hypothetical protein [Paraburkholderia panacisoli]|jgi:hypothetical protein|uniref:hypothetical protein n=1 Tax=Paraburkholderia panacisoli TaxID=2603818 RepID=UPI00165ECEC5|nr:hypothetical protein [Paraburkholderia panacisoli]
MDFRTAIMGGTGVAFRHQYVTVGQRVKPARLRETTGKLGDGKTGGSGGQKAECA